MAISIESLSYIDSAKLFSQVADQPWAVLLDSGVRVNGSDIEHSDNVNARPKFDVLAIQPVATLITQGASTTIERDGHASDSELDPLDLLRMELSHTALADLQSLPYDELISIPYMPGAIGYFSYDLSRRFERMPEIAVDDEKLPEMAIGIYHTIVVVDHSQKRTQIISCSADASQPVLLKWRKLIKLCAEQDNQDASVLASLRGGEIRENLNAEQYKENFQKIRNYTIEGDCYQVNLAKRFSVPVEGDPWQTYAALRAASPAPYGAFLNFPFASILSNSPESFIQCRQSQVITSPIKGTMPRDHSDPENDRRIANQLLNSEKDKAENLMIVDLMRNDLSRCCELGSVKVPKLFELHSFANVHHLISTVTGVLSAGVHALHLLRSCFPGGSITGAPKIRAMQIIEELEPHRRGVYCGSIAYVGADGSLETNIAIRTITVKDGIARYSAGGGLVIDSKVDEEYQEIIDKARMMTEALSND